MASNQTMGGGNSGNAEGAATSSTFPALAPPLSSALQSSSQSPIQTPVPMSDTVPPSSQEDAAETAAAAAAALPATASSQDACLHVSTVTWARDSHELFDYEARHVHKHSFFLNKAARAFRTALDVQLMTDTDPLPATVNQPVDFLLSIRTRDGRYAVQPADKNFHNLSGGSGVPAVNPKKLWLIVKELPSGNYLLQENDVIKLGRFKLRVRQLVKSLNGQPDDLLLDDVEPPTSNISSEDAITMQCRICLLDGGTHEDPLLCPCQCKGSIKFVHLECLRHWINGRLALPTDNNPNTQKSSYFFKQLHCELCKTPFPSAVMLNNNRVQIVKIPKIDPPFVILENIVGAANKGLHLISMGAKKELKLGRGHESDIRIADVSISRYHATIRFSDNEFVLEDHQSKFGTLVSLRRAQPIDKTNGLMVQIGRTVIRLSLRRPPHPFEGVLSVYDDPNNNVAAPAPAPPSALNNNNTNAANANAGKPRNITSPVLRPYVDGDTRSRPTATQQNNIPGAPPGISAAAGAALNQFNLIAHHFMIDSDGPPPMLGRGGSVAVPSGNAPPQGNNTLSQLLMVGRGLGEIQRSNSDYAERGLARSNLLANVVNTPAANLLQSGAAYAPWHLVPSSLVSGGSGVCVPEPDAGGLPPMFCDSSRSSNCSNLPQQMGRESFSASGNGGASVFTGQCPHLVLDESGSVVMPYSLHRAATAGAGAGAGRLLPMVIDAPPPAPMTIPGDAAPPVVGSGVEPSSSLLDDQD